MQLTTGNTGSTGRIKTLFFPVLPVSPVVNNF
jgi:hypothetical protein